MAASLMNMLDDLEARLERTQAELQALREENQRLKQQLVLEIAQEQNVPNVEAAATTELESEEAPDQNAPLADAPAEAKASKINEGSQIAEENQIAEESQVAEESELVKENKLVEESLVTEEKSVSATEKPDDLLPQAPSPHALLTQWYERYPNAFFKGHTKPLKVGIHQDLAEREEWPNKLIRRALANYVNLPRYIKAVRVGAERVDLDGQPAGKVDKEAAQHASEKRGEKKESGAPKKAQPKAAPAAKKPRQEAPKQPQVEKSEPHKLLSLEDKLLGLQQKFKGR